MSTTTDITRAVDLLGDADPDLRLRAAVDLGTWSAAEAAPALVERLGRERAHAVRETLTWALLSMPDAARPHLHAALASPRWLARLQASHVLSKLGDPRDAAALAPLAADSVDAVAARAWWAAGQTRNPLVAAPLAAQLARGDSELRNSLSVALAELGEPAVTALVAALRTGDAATREHAADTLALLGSPAADRAGLALSESLADPDADVRFAALNALGSLRTPLAWDAIDGARTSEDARLSHLAGRLAGRRPDRMPAAEAPLDPAATHGVVAAADGALAELTCASELVAHSAAFAALAQRVADAAAAGPARPRAGLLAEVGDELAELSAATGEPIEVGRVAHLGGRSAAAVYPAGPGRPAALGVLVAWEGPADERLQRRLLTQVAVCDPAYLRRGDVPAGVLEAIGREAAERARGAGRQDGLVDRIAAGAIETFLHETVLLEQVSVVDPGLLVSDLLYGTDVTLTGFARIEVGAGPR